MADRYTEKRDGQNVIPLRQDGKTKWALLSAGMGNAPTQFLYGEQADVLAAYEETGMTPDDIKETQEAVNAIPFSRFREIMEAERAGRCVVLPCKVGDTVYCFGWDCFSGMKYNCEDNGVMVGTKCRTCNVKKCDLHRSVREEQIKTDLWLISEFCYGNFGNTVFLTRKEAEAALAKEATQ